MATIIERNSYKYFANADKNSFGMKYEVGVLSGGPEAKAMFVDYKDALGHYKNLKKKRQLNDPKCLPTIWPYT